MLKILLSQILYSLKITYGKEKAKRILDELLKFIK